MNKGPSLRVKKFSEPRKMLNPFRDDEVEALKGHLGESHREVLTTYLETGMCRGELTNMAWKDVSFQDSGTITVRDPKNNEDRVIPMSQSVRQILSKRQLDQIVDFNYVFGTSGNILQVLKRAAKECLEESRRDRLQRRLRDSFGTKPADIGIPLDRIQTLMGYRMVVITRKYVQTRDQLDGKKHFASMPS